MFKLSEKGKRKFLDNFYWFAEEFEQDDFDNCVMLTVDEAEYALKVVRFAITTCEAVNEHKDKLWNFASLLHRRIAQAEKGNETK